MADPTDGTDLNLKGKGDLAELMVAADLRSRGFKIAIPFGEDCDFDLVLIREDRLERVHRHPFSRELHESLKSRDHAKVEPDGIEPTTS